jgi:hypothetical protein
MKNSNFCFSTIVILPAALLLQGVPARIPVPEAAASDPVSVNPPPLEFAPAQTTGPEVAPSVRAWDGLAPPPSSLAEWFGLRNAAAQEPPAAICELQPPLDSAAFCRLSIPVLPRLMVESSPLLPTLDFGWPANIIEAEDMARKIEFKPTIQPGQPRFGDSVRRWREFLGR